MQNTAKPLIGGPGAANPYASTINPPHPPDLEDYEFFVDFTPAHQSEGFSLTGRYTNPKLPLHQFGGEYDQLLRASPIQPAQHPLKCKFYMDLLFPDQRKLLCIGNSCRTMTTGYPYEFDLTEREPNLVVPAYLESRCMIPDSWISDPTPKTHRVSLPSNARFVVYRNDRDSPNEQASLIMRLSTKASLVMVVHTSMEVLEAWFSVVGWTDKNVTKFQKNAIRWGSWNNTLYPLQPYALPGGRSGRHSHCVPNKLVYFDPTAIGTKPRIRRKNILLLRAFDEIIEGTLRRGGTMKEAQELVRNLRHPDDANVAKKAWAFASSLLAK